MPTSPHESVLTNRAAPSKSSRTLTARLEPILFLAIFAGLLVWLSGTMGITNLMNTLMNTAYQLLIDTVLYIMGLAVLAGAVSALFSEFGVTDLINRLLSPLMRPLYGLPGAGALGIITTYLSDNPAILTLADDHRFRACFKQYQLPALTNLGTAFGMGMVVTAFMFGIQGPHGEGFGLAALVGNAGAIVGSIVSTRLMLHFTRKVYGTDAPCRNSDQNSAPQTGDPAARPPLGERLITALLNGGKSGVTMGVAIVPGVLIICTLVLVLTNGPAASGLYTGSAYEGVAILPWLGDKVSFLIKPLFGFSSAADISVPITALGAAGAAIGLVPKLVASGAATGHDVAVFTAMCMCWSGYLSTHVAMMSSLKCPELTGKAIISHTIGGLCAGVAANWLYQLVTLIL